MSTATRLSFSHTSPHFSFFAPSSLSSLRCIPPPATQPESNQSSSLIQLILPFSSACPNNHHSQPKASHEIGKFVLWHIVFPFIHFLSPKLRSLSQYPQSVVGLINIWILVCHYLCNLSPPWFPYLYKKTCSFHLLTKGDNVIFKGVVARIKMYKCLKLWTLHNCYLPLTFQPSLSSTSYLVITPAPDTGLDLQHDFNQGKTSFKCACFRTYFSLMNGSL